MKIEQVIDDQVKNNPIVLYMKGTPTFPQCGFSGTVVHILKTLGIKDYLAVNVLLNSEIREGVKVYSDWPTVPQLYVDGEFVGGCDIIRSMYDSGELQSLLSVG